MLTWRSRSSSDGHARRANIGEFVAASVFAIQLMVSGSHPGYDGVFKDGLKQHMLPGPADEAGHSGIFREVTLELWDFGVSVNKLDWSRLPSFRTSS